MRVLGSTVLVFEWLVLALGVPVAINTAGVPASGAWIYFGVLSLLIVTAVGTITRPSGVTLGWLVQGLILGAGFIVPLLLLLGIVFAVLWFFAVQQGQRVDAIRAARAKAGPESGPGAASGGSIGDTEPVGDGA